MADNETQILSISQCFLCLDEINYPVSSFDCSYRLDAVPTCSVTMSFGLSLEANTTAATTGDAFLEKLKLDTEAVEATLYLTVDGKDTIIFYGDVIGAAYSSSGNGSGSSRMQVQLMLQHPLGRLYAKSLSNVTYLDSATYNTLGLRLDVAKEYAARTLGGDYFKNNNMYTALDNLGEKYTKGNADTDIVQVIQDMVGTAYTIIEALNTNPINGVKNPAVAGKAKEVTQTIGGSIKLASVVRLKEEYIKQMCKNFAQFMSTKDILSSLLSTITSTDFLLHLAPTVGGGCTIKPPTAFVGKSDTYSEFPSTAIVYVETTISLGLDVRGADSLVLCGRGSAVMHGSTWAQGNVLARFPESANVKPARKMITITAPEWLNGQLKGDVGEAQGITEYPEEQEDEDENPDIGPLYDDIAPPKSTGRITDVAKAYAKLMYLQYMYKGSTLITGSAGKDTVTGDLYLINTIAALGDQWKLGIVQDATVNPLDSAYSTMYGTLASVRLAYNGVPGTANLYVSHGFTDVRTEQVQTTFEEEVNPLYE